MSIPKGDKWIEVEWNSGKISVVNVRYLLKSMPANEEVKIGTTVHIGRKEDGTPLTATVLRSARDRQQLDQPQRKPEVQKAYEDLVVAGPSAEKEEEPGDFSPSASDWEPSDNESSEDSEEEINKKIKLELSKIRQHPNKNSKKVMVPVHRPNAVIPNGMHQLALKNWMKSRKRAHEASEAKNTSTLGKKTLPDSTKKNQLSGKIMPLEERKQLIETMRASFQRLFRTMKELQPTYVIPETEVTLFYDPEDDTKATENNSDVKNENEGGDKSESDYSDRSDDNVLITNKYNNIQKKEKAENNDWIPIGSGTTLIHKEKFRKVNWKSYTIATRTLLMAAFPRRTLATHSLTGKKSPAFSNKPAKMCLDPKIVSDIVIEITDKFKVKDNLVRSIITTKCADECKMLKMKLSKKKSKNQENIPPAKENGQ